MDGARTPLKSVKCRHAHPGPALLRTQPGPVNACASLLHQQPCELFAWIKPHAAPAKMCSGEVPVSGLQRSGGVENGRLGSA